MAYEGKCGSCANFEEEKGNSLYSTSNKYYVKGYCNWYRAFYYPDDSCSDHYRSRAGAGGGCFITTIVCDVLGLDDHCEVMETLRKFRGDVLQKDEQYKDILFEYDTVGPKIAEEIRKEDPSFALALYNIFLKPISNLIKKNKKEEAISNYINMTHMLEGFYCISLDDDMPNDYDYHVGGHGIKSLKKVIN